MVCSNFKTFRGTFDERQSKVARVARELFPLKGVDREIPVVKL